MPATQFSVTLPDGTNAFRASKTRDYTHVVVGQFDGTWHALRWSSSAASAHQAVGSRDMGRATDQRVVAVDAETVAKPKPPKRKVKVYGKTKTNADMTKVGVFTWTEEYRRYAGPGGTFETVHTFEWVTEEQRESFEQSVQERAANNPHHSNARDFAFHPAS